MTTPARRNGREGRGLASWTVDLDGRLVRCGAQVYRGGRVQVYDGSGAEPRRSATTNVLCTDDARNRNGVEMLENSAERAGREGGRYLYGCRMRRVRRPSQKQSVFGTLWSRSEIRCSRRGTSHAGPCGVISSVANSNTTPRLSTHETGARCRILICFFRLTVSDRYLTRRHGIGLPCHRQMRAVSPRGPPPPKTPAWTS